MSIYVLSRAVMRALSHVVIRGGLEMHGLEKVPRSGAFMLVSNHVGSVDPGLAMMWIDRTDVYCMAKSEVFRTPFQRFVLRSWHGVPVVRESADRTALRDLLGLLAEGHVVVLFPEGTRSPDGRLQRAHAGAGFLARRSGVPIVPLAITGSHAVAPRGRYIPRRAPVSMTFGEPFQVPERNPDGSPMTHQQTVDRIMTRIAALLPEEMRGVYAGGSPSSDAPDAA